MVEWIQRTKSRDVNVEGFHEMLNVNLIGAFNALHAVVPHMKEARKGYIFNLASLCGKVGYAGIGAYTALSRNYCLI